VGGDNEGKGPMKLHIPGSFFHPSPPLVIANTFVQDQRIKGQGHSLSNRQHRLTPKCVGFSYLFNAFRFGRDSTCIRSISVIRSVLVAGVSVRGCGSAAIFTAMHCM